MNNINQAVSILKRGGLVAFPTETVYGLGADAKNAAAIEKIFQVKARPHDHPLIVHLANVTQLSQWAAEIPEAAHILAEQCWPGSLTLILKKRPEVLNSVTAGQDTVGLRIPHHPVALALLEAFGDGIVAPSANKFTHVSPTSALAVKEELGTQVDLILEGGDCQVGLESTILDLSRGTPVILRPGMISAERLSALLGQPVTIQQKGLDAPLAPGRHHLHYAPQTMARLVDSADCQSFFSTLTSNQLPVVLIFYSDQLAQFADTLSTDKIYKMQLAKNALDYAHDLYKCLRMADHLEAHQIVIENVPAQPEWDAIRDRLIKATAMRR